MPSFKTTQLKDFYLFTLMQEPFYRHLEAIKELAKKRGRPYNPVCHISYAWPVLEAETDLQARLLILEEDMRVAGINPNLDLQDVCSPEYKKDHPKTAPDYEDLTAFRGVGIAPGNTVFMIGTESYQNQTSDPHTYIYLEEQQMRPLFLAKKITVIPVMFSGDFPKSFAKGANYTAEIGFKLGVQEDYLRDLPNALARLHGIDRDNEFSGMRRAFEATLKMQQEGITPEVIQSRHQDLTRQLSQREDKYRNRIKVRLARFSTEQREQLDGRLAQLETQVRGKLMQQAHNLSINQPDSALSKSLAQADTDALISEKATNGEGQSLWQSDKAEKLTTHWDAFVSGQSSQTAWVLSGMPSGKRDWLKIQERILWQRWQQAQALAIQEPSLVNRRAAKTTPLPIYIDLAKPEQIANPYDQLIEQGLASLNLTQEEIDWIRQGQQLFLMIDGFELIQAETNLAARNAFYQWHVKVLYTCQSDYLEQTPHRALYFTPTDANQQPLSEQLAFIEVSHPERRNSVDRTLDHREAVKTISHDTTSKAAGLHQSLGKGLTPDQQASTHSAVQDAYWQTQARLMLQRETHTHPLHSLLQQFHDLASQQGTAVNQAFISYAWPAGEACVRLQERLRRLVADSAKMGIRVMLDVEQLAPGINVEDFMARELANSQAVFLIGTPRLKSRIAESWEQNGVIKRTNAYFEFERILTKHKDRALNTPSPICPLLLEGNSIDTSFPEEIRQASLTLIPFTEEATYFESFARFARGLLQLDSHPEAQQLLTDYLEAYQHQENTFTPDVLQNTIIRAKEDVAKRAEAQKKAFEELSAKLGQEMMQSLMAAQNDALAQAVQDYSTQAEVCKPDSFIRQALNSYVSLNYSLNPQYTEPQDLRQRVLSQIEAGFNQKEPRFLILEGNSGGGKSLFLSYLEHHYLTTYNSGTPIPVFVRLAQLTDPNHNLIQKTLSAQGYSDTLIHTIQQRKIPLVLLLDGFDELPLDQLDRQQTLYTRNALHEWNATVILSCRSQQLPVIERHLQTTIDQYWRRGEHAPRTDHVFITPFDATQIEQYLTHYVAQHPGSWPVSTYHQHLENIPGLTNLVQNPFVLRLVCEALPTLAKSDTTNLSRYDIYQAFTQQWFAKEQWRLITQESLPPKQAFVQDMSTWCEEQAWDLFQTKRVVMTLTEQTPQAQRRAAPIRLLEEGKAQFIHKSMQDYFAAKYCMETLDAGLDQAVQRANRHTWVGEPEFLSFMTDALTPEREARLWAMMQHSRDHKDYAQAASNAATAINAASIAFTGRDLHGIAIPGADLTNAIFDHANLEGADLSGVNFSLAWLAFANFKRTNLENVQWGERVDWLGHRGAVNAVVLSPDKKMLASGGTDGDIRLWDTRTGRCQRILPNPKTHAPVICLAFTPDGTQLVSGSTDHGVRLWRVDTGHLVREYDKGFMKQPEEKKYFRIENVKIESDAELSDTIRQFPPKTYVLVEKKGFYRCYLHQEDGVIRLLGALTQKMRALEGAIGGIFQEMSEIGMLPVLPNELKLDLKNRHMDKYRYQDFLETLQDSVHATHYGLSHQDVVKTVQVSEDGKTIYSASQDGSIYAWYVGQNGTRETFKMQDTKTITALVAPTQNNFVGVGAQDGSIQLFKANSGNFCINQLRGTDGSVSCLSYHPKGHTLLSGSNEGSIYAWVVRGNFSSNFSHLKALEHSPERGQAYVGHTAEVSGLAYSADQEWIISSSVDHSIRLWQRESGRCMEVIEHTRAPIAGFALQEDQDGRLVYTADADGRVRQNRLQSYQHVMAFRHKGAVLSLGRLQTKTGEYGLSLGEDGTLAWHTLDGRFIGAYTLPIGNQALSLDASGQTLVSVNRDGKVYRHHQTALFVWDSVMLARYPKLPAAFLCAKDGQHVWIAQEAHLYEYSLQPFCEQRILSGHRASINQIAQQRETLYTVGDDGLLCAWHLHQVVPAWQSTAHPGGATHLVVDANQIASAGRDNSVALWDKTGRCKHRLSISAPVVALAFKADGSQLAVLLKNRYVMLIETKNGQLLSAFMINANLPTVIFTKDDQIVIGDEKGHLQWCCWQTPTWMLLKRTQPQLLTQYAELDDAKGLQANDQKLLGQRLGKGTKLASMRLLSLLLDKDELGLAVHFTEYPNSFSEPMEENENSTLLNYVIAKGPTDLLIFLLQHAPVAQRIALQEQENLFDDIVQGMLNVDQAAQAFVALLGLQQTECPLTLPKVLGSYLSMAQKERSQAIVQQSLHHAIEIGQIDTIPTLLSWGANLKTPTAGKLPLQAAIFLGNRAMIACLLREGMDLKATDDNGETAIFWAIRAHQYDLVKEWLTDETSRQYNHAGITLVHLIAQHGWLEALKTVPQALLTVQDKAGMTPLHEAAKAGHLVIIDYYLRQNIALEPQNQVGHTPLMLAIQHNQAHVVKVLMSHTTIFTDTKGSSLLHLALAAKADHCTEWLLQQDCLQLYRYQPNKGKQTPLMLALIHAFDIAPFLNESTINTADEAGVTPLLLAVHHHRFEDILLQAGAEVNVQAANGDTPLNLAIKTQQIAVAERLLKQGALQDKTDAQGNAALHLAAVQGNAKLLTLLLRFATKDHLNRPNQAGETPLLLLSPSQDINLIAALLEKGASVNQVSKIGETALYRAAVLGRLSHVQFLLEKGADVNQATHNGFTPLYTASGNGHVDIVETLITKGAAVNRATHDGYTPLHIASQEGYADVVGKLIEKNAYINQSNDNGITPLYVASMNGHVPVVKLLLEKGVDVNQGMQDGTTPLCMASGNGHSQVVKLLLEKGADVNQANNNGFTPLIEASLEGHTDVVEKLLEKGADVNQANNNGFTPLIAASQEGNANVVEKLLEKGAEVNQTTNNDVTSLFVASANGHTAIIEMLLLKGAKVNQVSNDGVTPLFCASKAGHVRIVEILLEKGADVNKAYENGTTSLWIASQEGHSDIVEKLLEKNAEVNQVGGNGLTPLSKASQKGHKEIVKKLLEKGADVNQVAEGGTTSLYVASQAGHTGVVEILLEKGADVNQIAKDGITSLYVASQGGHAGVVERLLEKGANVNQVTKNGITPLCIASANGYAWVVEKLLEKDADINHVTSYNCTPLYLASSNGYVGVVKILLEKCANVNQASIAGFTPLHIASENGHLDIVEMLLEKGTDVNQATRDGCTPLYMASKNGHAVVVDMLLEKGAAINQADNNGVTPLYMVSHNGHARMVEVLISKGADVNQATRDGCTPLYIASKNGHAVVVDMLLEKGVDVDQTAKGGVTPLWIASQNGHEHVVGLLLQKGASVNQADDNGFTPLFVACQYGHEAIVCLLLDRGASVNATRRDCGTTPLLIACQKNHETLVRLLLNQGAHVDQASNDGFTTLLIACDQGYEMLSRLLLEHGANVDQAGNDGTTPLWRACKNGYEVLVRLLLENGAIVDKADNDDSTPLWIASQNGHEGVVRLLLENKAAVDKAANNGVTPLLMACFNGHEAVARLLLENGAAVDKADNDDSTPLWIASQNGHEGVVRLLLEHGASMYQANENGATPLWAACYNGFEAVACLLLDRGARVNQANHDGFTPLYVACQNGHKAMARLLLECGAHVDQANKNGATPLWIACYNSHEAVAHLLLEYGSYVDQADKDGFSSLWIACQNGHEAVVRLLLDQGAHVNAARNDGTTPLWIACTTGYKTVMRLLLERGASVDAPRNDGNTSLLIACQNGDEAAVCLLLDWGAQMDQANEDGITSLWLTCQNGHEAAARLLLDKGADVDKANNEGITPLYIASKNGHKEIVRLLLEKGGSVDIVQDDGTTLLYVVSANGHEGVVCLLLDYGAQVNQADEDGTTPLWIACQNNHEAVARLLLDRGAQVNQADKDGFTPLYAACQSGHEKVARLLLDHGAHVDQANKRNLTSLHAACYGGHEVVVHLLLDRGAQVNQDGMPPLWMACQNNHETVVRLLLDRGAQVDQTDEDGTTLLHLACQNGDEAIARLLLEHGASMEQTNNEGCTPLLVACINGHEAVVRLLLDRGANGLMLLWIACVSGLEAMARLLLECGVHVNQTEGGASLLLTACQNGHEAIARLLLDHGAQVDQANQDGITPLLFTCAKGHEAVVRLLLERGASVEHQNQQGNTALHVAVENGQSNIVKLLLVRASQEVIKLKNAAGKTAEKLAKDSRNHEIIALFEQTAQVRTSPARFGAYEGPVSAQVVSATKGLSTKTTKITKKGVEKIQKSKQLKRENNRHNSTQTTIQNNSNPDFSPTMVTQTTPTTQKTTTQAPTKVIYSTAEPQKATVTTAGTTSIVEKPIALSMHPTSIPVGHVPMLSTLTIQQKEMLDAHVDGLIKNLRQDAEEKKPISPTQAASPTSSDAVRKNGEKEVSTLKPPPEVESQKTTVTTTTTSSIYNSTFFQPSQALFGVIEQKSREVRQKGQVTEAELSKVLDEVGKGHLNEVQTMLKKSHVLLHAVGNMTDVTEKTYTNITVLQYAFIAGDIEMCKMILREFREEERLWVARQIDTFEILRHGGVFTLDPTLKAYRELEVNWQKWSEKKRDEQWCKVIGSCQKNWPAWLRYDFTEEGYSNALWCQKKVCGVPESRNDNKEILSWYLEKIYELRLGDGFAWLRSRSYRPSGYRGTTENEFFTLSYIKHKDLGHDIFCLEEEASSIQSYRKTLQISVKTWSQLLNFTVYPDQIGEETRSEMSSQLPLLSTAAMTVGFFAHNQNQPPVYTDIQAASPVPAFDVIEQKSREVRQKGQVMEAELSKVLDEVGKGHLDQVRMMLRENYALLYATGYMRDITEKTYPNITVMQYAFIVGDIGMCEMILKEFREEGRSMAVHQINEEEIKRHSGVFTLEPTLQAYRELETNWKKWSKKRRDEHWCKVIGGCQKNWPAWLRYDFTEEGHQNALWFKKQVCGVPRVRNDNEAFLNWNLYKFPGGAHPLGERFAWSRPPGFTCFPRPRHGTTNNIVFTLGLTELADLVYDADLLSKEEESIKSYRKNLQAECKPTGREIVLSDLPQPLSSLPVLSTMPTFVPTRSSLFPSMQSSNAISSPDAPVRRYAFFPSQKPSKIQETTILAEKQIALREKLRELIVDSNYTFSLTRVASPGKQDTKLDASADHVLVIRFTAKDAIFEDDIAIKNKLKSVGSALVDCIKNSDVAFKQKWLRPDWENWTLTIYANTNEEIDSIAWLLQTAGEHYIQLEEPDQLNATCLLQ